MPKRWLAIREKSVPALRRSLIVSLSLTALVGAVYLLKPVLWSGGLGIGKDQAVITESVEKNANGNVVKSIKTTKYDDGKTLWDWMSLLGVPLSLAVLGFWLQQNQQKRAEKVAKDQKERDEKVAQVNRERDVNLAKEQREIAADEAKEEVLQVFFDRLSVLLVDKNLLAIASKVNSTETQETEGQPKNEATLEERELLDSAVDVIRARTLSILRRFENDTERKTSVIRFLIESDIVSKLKLSLRDADLSGAKLFGVNLSESDLRRSQLPGAELNGADLFGVNLELANLSKADLCFANLKKADLSKADLSKADLSKADLRESILTFANLVDSTLTGTKFSNSPGLTDAAKADFKRRGAIFLEDTP
jgi:uncharacterized protein YjbI with pentapeptide repeats